jgi:flagellar protein FliS
MQLVVQLYEGAINAVSAARSHNAQGDPHARGVMINRAVDILSELILSLDPAAGVELGRSLKELYGYMQHALLDAHARQSEDRLVEVAGLLSTLLEGWRGVAASAAMQQPSAKQHQPATPPPYVPARVEVGAAYGALAF